MTCIINNGSVYDNDFQWKLCDHAKKFVFLGGTTLKYVDVQNIPPKRYYFKDFSDVLGGKCELNRLEGNHLIRFFGFSEFLLSNHLFL